jgi:hypothetical protein
MCNNHEMWTVCEVCGEEYDLRGNGCCRDSAGLTMTMVEN